MNPSISSAAPAAAPGRPGALPTGAVARKGSAIIADQIAYGAANFASTILVARAAGQSELGIYTLGLSLLLIGFDMQNSVVLIPYTVFSPRHGEAAQPRLAGSALLHTLALGVAAALACLALGALAPLGVRPLGSAAACLALGAGAPLLFLRQHARMAAIARLRVGEALRIDLLAGALMVGGLALLMHMGGLTSAVRALGVAALACAAGAAWWLAAQRGALAACPRHALQDFRANWHFSKWLVTTTPVAILRSQLPLWLLTWHHGPAAAGLLAACASITALANPLLTGAGNFIGTRAAHLRAGEGPAALRGFILRATAAIGVMMAAFLLLILACGDRLAVLIYGPGYAGLGGVIAVLAGGVLAGALAAPAWRGLLALGRSGVTLSTEALMLGVQLTLGFWLVGRWGLAGAALATLAGNLAGMLYQVARFTACSR